MHNIRLNSLNRVVYNTTQPSTNISSGSLIINGGISIGCTSNSLSITSGGALSIAGGASISKDIRVGNSVYVTDNMNSTLVSSSSLGATGATVGTLYASVVTSANVQASGTVSTGTLVCSLVSSGSLGAAGATIGTLYANNITVSNLYVSGSTISMNITTVNTIETNTTTGTLNVTTGITTGTLNVTGASIMTGGITTGNINFTGSLFQNSSPYSVALPPGFIIQYAASSAPSGWLLCDGSAVSRTTYSALFAIISTSYGSGNGSTTFNVPDLRGRVPVGFGQGSGLTNRSIANTGGAETHTLTTSEMPSHSHSVYDPGHSHAMPGNYLRWAGGDRTAGGGGDFGGKFGDYTGSSGTGISLYNAGGGGSHNNMQPFVVVNFVIKT